MSIYQEIKREAKLRLQEESLARILQCVNSLTDNQIWWKPNNVTNSIGNLVLHLSGNITQYLHHGVGGQPDIRQRNVEFSTEFATREVLINSITKAIKDGIEYVHQVSDNDWLTQIDVQCFKMTKYSAVSHVVEHCSYHVGQITQLTKLLTKQETGYYAEMKLD